jgi:hypothetical protein
LILTPDIDTRINQRRITFVRRTDYSTYWVDENIRETISIIVWDVEDARA